MIKEEWKQIDGFEYYYISNLGRVKSTRRWSGTQFYEREKIISLHKHKTKGYIYVSISRDGKNYNLRVHRLVAKAFIPNPNNKPQVNHIDGNKSNNNVDNLEWCSHKYNVQHAFKNGLHNPVTRIPKRYRQKCDLAYEYIIRNRRKDGFLSLNEWQTEDLLKILEVNDAKR